MSVIEALRVLATQADDAIAEIDKRIAEHQAKINELRAMRDMIGGRKKSTRRPTTTEKLDEWKSVASDLASVMTEGQRYSASELAEILSKKLGRKIGFPTVGRIVAANPDVFRSRRQSHFTALNVPAVRNNGHQIGSPNIEGNGCQQTAENN